MKSFCVSITTMLVIICSSVAYATNYWHAANIQDAPQNLQVQHPDKFLVYRLTEAPLRLQLQQLSEDPEQAGVFSLPLPDGSFRDFRIWQMPMMPQELATRNGNIMTFSGAAVGNSTITLKAEFTLYGFTAMVYDGDNTFLIDPYDNYNDGLYMVHYRHDEVRADADRMRCQVKSRNDGFPGKEQLELGGNTLPAMAHKTFNGHNLRTYRLALSANHYYCQAVTGLSSPTIAQCLAKMTVTMNRVNGIYNRDFSVQMNFCAAEDDIIWPTLSGSVNGLDPFTSINSDGNACLDENQIQCDTRIGTANYDLGHVFTTGGGGISSLGVVCSGWGKAQSCTGSPSPVGDAFDVDYVAHEMGHEFGSDHTFNNNQHGSCFGNAEVPHAYEPGSGATIMDYAGICAPDNLQSRSDPYFGASSLVQIQAELAGAEGVCAVTTNTGNKLVSLAPFTASYAIPYKTPFELIGPIAVDSVADTATTYGWAQWNLGDFGKTFAATFFRGPIFRSFNPVYKPIRVFPKMSMVLAGTASVIGEKMPDTTRFLTFKMVVRNILNGKGCFLFPDDTIHIDAISTGAANGYQGFKVTSQGSTGLSYTGGTPQTITWNVAGSDAAPVNTANVDIYMSKDGGNSWPYPLGTFPNTGSASVTIANPAATSSTCRFKVKGAGNVFFNVNLKNFTVTYNSDAPVTPVTAVATVSTFASGIKLYPIPARQTLNIATGSTPVNIVIYNTVGQVMWSGSTNDKTELQVGLWARGFYHARFINATQSEMTVKSFVLE